LCREAIVKHLNLAAIAAYEQALKRQREQLKRALPEAVRQVLANL
jgi:hypothetical protein